MIDRPAGVGIDEVILATVGNVVLSHAARDGTLEVVIAPERIRVGGVL